MIYFLVLISTLIVTFLSIFHFYWAVGGKLGFNPVLPIHKKGFVKLRPKWLDSLTISVLLGIVVILFAAEINFSPILIVQLIRSYIF